WKCATNKTPTPPTRWRRSMSASATPSRKRSATCVARAPRSITTSQRGTWRRSRKDAAASFRARRSPDGRARRHAIRNLLSQLFDLLEHRRGNEFEVRPLDHDERSTSLLRDRERVDAVHLQKLADARVAKAVGARAFGDLKVAIAFLDRFDG